MELWIWSCLEERTGVRPSISSKKITEGWYARAWSNSSRSCFSASPTHLERQSAPFRMKNEMRLPPYTSPP